MKTTDSNQSIRLTVIDTNENGDGFARIGRMALFVPGLVAGDTADVTVTDSRKNYAVGRCDALIAPSGHRIPPECPAFGTCGGCTLGHVTYAYENIVKQNCVKAALRRMKLPQDPVVPTLFLPARTAYRNKIGLHYDRDARRFGYVARDGKEILPFDGCLLCGDVMNAVVRFTNENIRLLEDLSPAELFLRQSHDGTLTVSVYTSSGDADLPDYRAALKEAFPEVTEVLRIPENEPAQTAGTVTEEYLGVTMRYASEVFRQVNRDAAEILMRLVCDFAAEEPFSYAADLYCGSGAFGLVLARRFPEARFFGLEIDRDAIRAAKSNAEANGLTNISFVCADAASFDGKIPAGDGTFRPPEFVVVDPPRAGLSDKMRNGLIRLAPERLAYISCNPQTMARDLAELVRGGYEILRVTPVNMFPMTKHCECAVFLRRSAPDNSSPQKGERA